MSPISSNNDVKMNDYSGIYVNGKPYSITTKNEVVQVYHRLQRIDPTSRPKLLDIAKEARVSKGYAHKVLKELRVAGFIEDPELVLKRKAERTNRVSKLGPEESLFLLALREEDDQRPLYIYAKLLEDKLGVKVSHQTVDNFFKK
jgi:DNA-binding MarR family transcriptional regulator